MSIVFTFFITSGECELFMLTILCNFTWCPFRVGFVEGVWMVGVIDELRMPISESTRFPVLVDTKTRVRATLPGEPQKRNGRYKLLIQLIKQLPFTFSSSEPFGQNLCGRFQLMCYKYMWDTLVADKFPTQKFYDFFSLNPNHILSPEIRDNTAKSGFPSEVNCSSRFSIYFEFLHRAI